MISFLEELPTEHRAAGWGEEEGEREVYQEIPPESKFDSKKQQWIMNIEYWILNIEYWILKRIIKQYWILITQWKAVKKRSRRRNEWRCIFVIFQRRWEQSGGRNVWGG